ncbi:hypothetical protein SAMN04490178_10765 [Propionispora vibrioides]|uniref:Uncharacterized protein n=1 Tax=Propionispora vibrioides TaxID=112903 RepID=A0A1H8TQL9_9FIRM|nr:hypothetical protein SAMN04490178_10765 [Propionispora vibrioides]
MPTDDKPDGNILTVSIFCVQGWSSTCGEVET